MFSGAYWGNVGGAGVGSYVEIGDLVPNDRSVSLSGSAGLAVIVKNEKPVLVGVEDGGVIEIDQD